MKKSIFILLLFLTSSVFGQTLTPQQKPMHGLQINWAQPLSKGLVGFWLLNEGSGDRVFDLSGNGNTGTLVNGLWIPEGLRFVDADMREITFTGYSGLLPDVWTVVACCKPTHSQPQNCLITFCYGTSPNTGVFLPNASNGRAEVSMNAQSRRRWYHTGAGAILWDGNFHTVAFTMPGAALGDISNAEFYMDGVLQAVYDTVDTEVQRIKTEFRIGHLRSSYYATMDIKWLYLFNRILSASEITELYREPFVMFQKDNIVLIASVAAPPAGGGQFIMIQMSMIPLFLIFTLVCFIKGRNCVK